MVSVRGCARRAILIAVLGSGAPGRSHAQASAFVPLDDAAYAYVDALMARGRLRSLPVMERPYTTAAIRRALAEDSIALGRVGVIPAPLVSALRRSLAAYESGAPPTAAAPDGGRFAASVALSGLVTAQSSARREVMLADDENGVYPGAIALFQARASHVVATTRIVGDLRLKDDPEFTGKKERSIAGRVEDAYVSAQWKYGELFLGRQARSWGPPPLDGLLLGGYAYSYDHLFARFGGERIALAALVTRLDDLSAGPDTTYRRYFGIHRLAVRAGAFEGAVTEAMVYGGVGEGFRLAFLNPLNDFQLSQYNERERGNLSLGLDLAWRTRAGLFAAQALLDDAQVDDCTPRCQEPPSYGFTFVAEGLPLAGGARWFASHTRVTNLAYRTPDVWERYASFDIGLGRGFSDYDETRLGVDLVVLPGFPLRAYAALRRQGEGDYRIPFPDSLDYAATPTFLSGVVTRVGRVAVSGGGRIGTVASLQGDVGVNRVTNAEHTPGRSQTRLEGRIRLVVLGWRWGMHE